MAHDEQYAPLSTDYYPAATIPPVDKRAQLKRGHVEDLSCDDPSTLDLNSYSYPVDNQPLQSTPNAALLWPTSIDNPDLFPTTQSIAGLIDQSLYGVSIGVNCDKY